MKLMKSARFHFLIPTRRLIFTLVLVDFLTVLPLVLFPPWTTALQISQPNEIAVWWIVSPPPPVPVPGAWRGGLAYHIDMESLVDRVAAVVISSFILVPAAIAISGARDNRNPKTGKPSLI
jgi:hypothetical protein